MKNLLILCSVLFVFGSCKKDSSTTTGQKENILTSGKWKLKSSTSLTNFGGTSMPFDLYAIMQSCQKDNLYIFNTDHTITMDEGVAKCNPADQQVKTGGNWQMLDNETKLQFNDPTNAFLNTLTAEILQLDNSALTIKYTTTVNGISSVTTTSYAYVP